MPQARADFLSGQICAVLANIHRKEDARVFEAGDFLPAMRVDEEEDAEAADTPPDETIDIEGVSRQLATMLGKKET